MQQWKQELLEINTASNHQQTIENVLESFLTSDYANCRKKRTEVLIFFNHLKKIF